MSKKSRNYTLILVLGICILIVIGRFAQKQPAAIPDASLKLAEKQAQEKRDDNALVQAQPQSASEESDDEKVADCTQSLKAQVKRDNTAYDKETILVGFKSAIDFAEAKVILSGYKLGIESEASSKESYPSNRILTATVNSGDIFEKICLVKMNAGVRYAGLNTIFMLHQ